MSASPIRLTRRQLLVGGSLTAGAVILGACGDDDASDAGDTTSSTAPVAGSLVLAQFFGGPMFVAGEEARLPFGVADENGLLPTEDTPEQLTVQIVGPDGEDAGSPVDVPRHAEGIPRAYFPLRITVDEPGIYTARTEIEGKATEMSFQVHSAADVVVVRPGTGMPALETPTTDDARGVDPLCTADPVCPLHEVTLAQALSEGAPVALLVATPAFCQITICGPVLDVLLDVVGNHPGVRFLHAEVYADPAKDLETYAPAVSSLGMHFEPCLILVGADGRVVDRIDTIYDRTELDARLSAL